MKKLTNCKNGGGGYLLNKAFTLIELLAVIIILAIVALIATPIILDVVEDARISAGKSEVQMILGGINNYCATEEIKSQMDSNYSKICTSSMDSEDVKEMVNLGNADIKEIVYDGKKLTTLVIESNNHKFTLCPSGQFVMDDEKCDGGNVAITTGPIKDVVLSNFPYLATNGNGCVTSTSNNYSYMGGCYLRGSSQSGEDRFYSTMNDWNGLTEEEVTEKFFDSEGNFSNEAYDNYNFENEYYTEQDLTDAGVGTTFELDFGMSSEELFAQQAINSNSLWYSGFLWRIMGINADGSVRLITDENVTAIPWGASNTAQNWDGSYAKDWLNNYFYSRLKENNIIKEQTWCSETTTNENSVRTTCTNNLSTQSAYVGLITLDEYNLAGGGSSYLNIGQSPCTMTLYSNYEAWCVDSDGTAYYSYVFSEYGLRAVINVNSDVTITSGNGTLGEIWSSQSGPYILNEDKNVEITGNLNEKSTSGEYVLFVGKKYRVVDKDNNGNTKLILDGYYEEDDIIIKIGYGDDNEFSATAGIGQKLNVDVLNWITNNSESEKAKLVSNYTWYQNEFDRGQSYTVSLNEESPTRNIQATVGLIRVGEMLSGQSSSILTKGYTTISNYDNAKTYWTMTPHISSSKVWNVSFTSGENDLGDVVYGMLSLRPVIVIKSNVEIIGGTGTFSNPYQI